MKIEDAKDLVVRFLRLMETRDLETAESLMAPGLKVTFPGNRHFSSQREVVAAAIGRYRWIKKRFDKIDVFPQDDAIIVYVIGTLYGVNMNDISFADIRFIDRFLLRNGRIEQQDVWNDLAESGVLTRVA